MCSEYRCVCVCLGVGWGGGWGSCTREARGETGSSNNRHMPADDHPPTHARTTHTHTMAGQSNSLLTVLQRHDVTAQHHPNDRIHNADIHLGDDYEVDDLVDVIEGRCVCVCVCVRPHSVWCDRTVCGVTAQRREEGGQEPPRHWWWPAAVCVCALLASARPSPLLAASSPLHTHTHTNHQRTHTQHVCGDTHARTHAMTTPPTCFNPSMQTHVVAAPRHPCCRVQPHLHPGALRCQQD